MAGCEPAAMPRKMREAGVWVLSVRTDWAKRALFSATMAAARLSIWLSFKLANPFQLVGFARLPLATLMF